MICYCKICAHERSLEGLQSDPPKQINTYFKSYLCIVTIINIKCLSSVCMPCLDNLTEYSILRSHEFPPQRYRQRYPSQVMVNDHMTIIFNENDSFM